MNKNSGKSDIKIFCSSSSGIHHTFGQIARYTVNEDNQQKHDE